MNDILIAVISVTSIGLICATLLSVVSKIMAVKADPLLEQLTECMPGANCGACGYSGCNAYAAALAQGEAGADKCPPGGNDLAAKLSDILGLGAPEGAGAKVAVVHCMGNHDTKRDKMEYTGISTCRAAKPLYNGQSACTFGCIGYGDCLGACPSGAICIEKGLARIDPRKCTGCGLCVKACPCSIISMESEPLPVAVMCASTEKGAAMKDKCTVGCIGCMKCVKACPREAITVTDFLASIDYTKCDGCEFSEYKKCVESCPKSCIVSFV